MQFNIIDEINIMINYDNAATMIDFTPKTQDTFDIVAEIMRKVGSLQYEPDCVILTVISEDYEDETDLDSEYNQELLVIKVAGFYELDANQLIYLFKNANWKVGKYTLEPLTHINQITFFKHD
ncbi:MAG: hypothetical protein WC679_01505 [Bacteroidales bacterium]|jgi:hypothetical protein